jgi:hypothetical protein
MASTHRSLIALALTACAAIAVVAVDRYDKWVRPAAVHVARWAGWAVDWMVRGLVAAVGKLPAPARTFLAGALPRHQVVMRDYVARQTRLQAARKFPQWSFAPSA